MINRPAGIDLGTTNSAIAVMRPEGDDIWLLQDRLRRKTVPSMVGWNPEVAEFVVGHRAWNRRVLQPQPVASIKRKMGSQQRVEVGPHKMLPEEVSAKTIENLVAQMREFIESLGDLDAVAAEHQICIERAVITVPAYFDAPQIEATRVAGELAGVEVLGLLQEPTAAAMYYAFKNGIGDGNFLVYDLGGGTFDVSIIRSLMGEYQVLAVDGDNFLGGDDFDRRLAEKLRKHLVDQGYKLDLNVAENADDRLRFTLLERIAREVKEALTSSEVQYVGRRDIFEDQAGQSVTLDLEIGRDEFEELIEDLIDQSLEACTRALAQSKEQADVELGDIDYVLLVGGSTHVPRVQEKIAAALCGPAGARGERPLVDEPDTCVALGAAIHAANLSGVQWVQETSQEDGDSKDDSNKDAPKKDALKLTVTSSLSTRNEATHLIGFLEGPFPKGITSVALATPNGEIASICRAEEISVPNTQIRFEFDTVALRDAGRHDFVVEFCEESGDCLTSFPIFLQRLADDAPYRPTGSALSNPSVLAKDIYLEVAGDATPDRFLLVPRGSSLPTRQEFRFYTADRSGAVLLRLFQNRYPIRTIHLEIPDETELGAPVNLTIEVDETMAMIANGDVDGQTFSAKIAPPPAQALRNWEQIEEILDQTAAVRQKLWGLEQKSFAKRVDFLVAGIHETVRTDPDKLQVLVRRLETVLEDYRNRQTELTPAYSRFTTLLNAIKRVAYRDAEARPLGRSIDEWHKYLDDIEKDANTAWKARDQTGWSQAFDQIQATWESLAQDEYRFKSTHTTEYVQRLHFGLSRQCEELQKTVDEFTLSSNPETESLQRREIMRLKADLEDDLEEPLKAIDIYADAAKVKPELAQLTETATRMEKRVIELATLGLVRR